MEKLIILIVGASGVGKDSLFRRAKEAFPEFNFIKRYITREPDDNEDNLFLSEKKFKSLKENNFFISSWVAHGNCYGIAKEDIRRGVNFVSISRGAVGDFERVYGSVFTIHVRVSRCELEKRLKARGRESADEIEKRVARSYKNIEAKRLIEFDNSPPIKESLKSFVKLIDDLILSEKV